MSYWPGNNFLVEVEFGLKSCWYRGGEVYRPWVFDS